MIRDVNSEYVQLPIIVLSYFMFASFCFPSSATNPADSAFVEALFGSMVMTHESQVAQCIDLLSTS